MILFINIVTSTFPALALSVEPTHKSIMTYKPRDPKEKLLSSYILTKILIIFPIMMFGAFLLFLWELQIGNSSIEKAMTVAFLVMVFSGLFHTLNAKKLHTSIFTKDFFSNKYLFISIIFSTLVTLAVVFTEYGREVFGLELIGVYDWVLVLGFSFAIIAFSEIIKLSIKSEFQEQTALRGVKNYLEQ
jgi:Ca2+-transporting ATPase